MPEDDREAVKWFRKAAEQGDASAQYNLGVMYANGEGVPEDYVKAYAWQPPNPVNLAAAQGQKDVVKSKDRLRPKMTSAQVAKAQELAGELYKRTCMRIRKPPKALSASFAVFANCLIAVIQNRGNYTPPIPIKSHYVNQPQTDKSFLFNHLMKE